MTRASFEKVVFRLAAERVAEVKEVTNAKLWGFGAPQPEHESAFPVLKVLLRRY